MKELRTMDELIIYMLDTKAPYPLRSSAMTQMRGIEECNKGGAASVMIIAENEDDASEAEAAYSLSKQVPEFNRMINTLDGAYWNVRVYVFGDDGGGMIYYERVPLL